MSLWLKQNPRAVPISHSVTHPCHTPVSHRMRLKSPNILKSCCWKLLLSALSKWKWNCFSRIPKSKLINFFYIIVILNWNNIKNLFVKVSCNGKEFHLALCLTIIKKSLYLFIHRQAVNRVLLGLTKITFCISENIIYFSLSTLPYIWVQFFWISHLPNYRNLKTLEKVNSENQYCLISSAF